LAKEGVKLSLVYLNSKEKAGANAYKLNKLGCEAIAVQADITTEEGIGKMINSTVKRFGGLDILILDAAYNEFIPFQELDSLDKAKWEFILNYNLTAPYLAIRKAVPFMKKRGGGRIITISSIAGLYPSGSSIAYAVSKSGLIHLTRCPAVALAPDILINNVAPGLMEGTRITSNLIADYIKKALNNAILKRATEKDDVAQTVVLLARLTVLLAKVLSLMEVVFFIEPIKYQKTFYLEIQYNSSF